MKKYKDYLFYIILFVSTVCFSLSGVFLSNEILAGLLTIISIILFVYLSRLIENKKQFFIYLLMLWLSLGVRFFQLYANIYDVSFLIALCFIPMVIVFGIGIKIGHYLRNKKLLFLEALVFPIIYTLIVLFVIIIKLGNVVNIITYVMCIPFINYNISWLKEIMFTFIITLFISFIINVLIIKEKRRKLYSLIPVLIIILILLIGSSVYSIKKSDADYSLNIAIATHEEMDLNGNTVREFTKEDRYKIFENAVTKAKENKADLLVLDEEFCAVYESDEEEALDFYAKTIKENQMPTLVCIDLLKEEDLCVNKALFFDKDGNILASYIKRSLVPFIESAYYEKGENELPFIKYDFNGKEVNISFAICFDINNEILMNNVDENTELLIIPSWDWNNCNEEQKRTRIRSIELNTTILKHTYEGYSYVSGPFGLIGDYIDNRNCYESIKMVNVPIWEK